MIRTALLLLPILLCAGCNRGGDKQPAAPPVSTAPAGTDEEQVRQTVLRYDRLLAEGYRTLNMNPLGEVATPDVAQKEYIHMAAIGEGKARMLSTPKKIDFLGVERKGPETFTVRTREVWDFSYVDIATGAPSGEVKDFVYLVTFTLRREGGKWLVADVAAEAPSDSAGPPAARPGAGPTSPPPGRPR